MKKPYRKDFMTGDPQMDHDTDLSKYYDALEEYVVHLEKKLDQAETTKQLVIIEANRLATKSVVFWENLDKWISWVNAIEKQHVPKPSKKKP